MGQPAEELAGRFFSFVHRLSRSIVSGIRNPILFIPLLRNIFVPRLILSRYLREFRPEHTRKSETDNSGHVGLSRCKVLVINLRHRIDRRDSFVAQAHAIGLRDFNFFQAIKDDRGSRGCALSHRSVLRTTEIKQGEMLMICEDDCEFLASRSELDEVIEEFYKNDKLDVLCLGFNTPNSWEQARISPNLLVTENTQTTSCYIVKPHVQELLESVAASSADALLTQDLPGLYEYDVVWKTLQGSYFFAVPSKRMVKQIASHSDIENAFTNYGV